MDDPRLGRIRFRAWRRGFREADLILGGFADRHLAAMSGAELDAFEALLEEADHDIYAWVLGSGVAPAHVDAGLIERLRAFKPWADESAARGG